MWSGEIRVEVSARSAHQVLLLDRENQQALLRRGLLPARHLPAAAVQRPHCVADAYRRHTRA